MPEVLSTTEAVHALWDTLADIETSRVEHARDVLLRGLCDLVDARNACWVGAVRMGQAQLGDPVSGWRPRIVHHLHPAQQLADAARVEVRKLEAGVVDVTTMRNVALAGTWRSNRLVDLVPADWFEGDYYRALYLARGHVDAIWAGVPVDADAEIYVGLFRYPGQPWFTEGERDAVGQALRGLRWFHRQQMLGHGLGAMPLTELERKVLCGLLGGLTDKQIAGRLGMSVSTTHEYASRIYRKYAVANRSSLMALWLGQPIVH